MIRKSCFTEIKSAAITVLVTMIAAVAAQATVINIDRDGLGFWSDNAGSAGRGVAFHMLAESAKKVYKNHSITLHSAYNEEQIWYGNSSIIGDDVLVDCQGNKKKGGSSAEEIVLNIVGQFSNNDSSKPSFSQLDVDKIFAKGLGRYAGLSSNESLKAVLRSYNSKSNGKYSDDKFIRFAEKCYDKNHEGNGNHQQGSDPAVSIPEPSTLAIFAIASFCFMVKGKNRLGSRF